MDSRVDGVILIFGLVVLISSLRRLKDLGKGLRFVRTGRAAPMRLLVALLALGTTGCLLLAIHGFELPWGLVGWLAFVIAVCGLVALLRG
jgi:hypothetical protein